MVRAGGKKLMRLKDLPKHYDPKQTEDKWYRFWLEKKFFHADVNTKKEAFSIVIPPPNVTDVLHVGHALNNTLQDILIRWKRMQGYEVGSGSPGPITLESLPR